MAVTSPSIKISFALFVLCLLSVQFAHAHVGEFDRYDGNLISEAYKGDGPAALSEYNLEPRVYNQVFRLAQIAQGSNSQTPQGSNSQTPQGQNTGSVTNPLSFKTIQAFFAALLGFLAMLAVPFIVFMLIFTGFKFVYAQGKPEALATAQKMLFYTIIGGMLILGASIIAKIIGGTIDNVTDLGHVLQAAAPLLNFQL